MFGVAGGGNEEAAHRAEGGEGGEGVKAVVLGIQGKEPSKVSCLQRRGCGLQGCAAGGLCVGFSGAGVCGGCSGTLFGRVEEALGPWPRGRRGRDASQVGEHERAFRRKV